MTLLVPAVVFAVLYVVSRRQDARRLRNGVFLVAALGSLLLAGVLELAASNAFLQGLVLLGFVAVGLLIVVLAVFLVGNGVTMMRLEGRSLGNLLSLLAGLAVLVLPATALLLLFLPGQDRLPSWASTLLVAAGILLFFGCAYAAATFAAFGLYSLVYSRYRHTREPEVLVVLGSGLIRGEVPPLLRSRLDRALAIYRSVPTGGRRRPLLIPSGGQGADEPRPEGEAMAEYLVAQGADPDDVRAETASTSTRENLLLSREVQRQAGRVGRTLVVTNDYHVLRAALLARAVGSDAQVVGSPTAAYYVPSAFLREYVAIMVEHRRLNLAAVAAVVAFVGLVALVSALPL
ncbi:vancomycin permeability regulator SanA [Frigoribacterium sp. PhB160]|uniref:YdcF family protein n=1 Tax=Frigoribacterium sp. PhB160 TaxID=2485192 RepID=UPI000F484125|nr:YdcF family protein [Frigoribacterium sp. PhB160]ROS59031.1 vancomycin permeability regulator SanA [Frigoribacterium sp. PhB160]